MGLALGVSRGGFGCGGFRELPGSLLGLWWPLGVLPSRVVKKGWGGEGEEGLGWGLGFYVAEDGPVSLDQVVWVGVYVGEPYDVVVFEFDVFHSVLSVVELYCGVGRR